MCRGEGSERGPERVGARAGGPRGPGGEGRAGRARGEGEGAGGPLAQSGAQGQKGELLFSFLFPSRLTL